VTRPAVLILVAAASVVAGAALPSQALFAAGCAFGFVTIAALVRVLVGARTVRISRRVPVGEVEEDRALSVFLSVRQPRWWPLRVEVQVGSVWHPLGAEEFRIDVHVGRRGPQELPPPPVRVTDPLGLAERRSSVGAPVRILVLPRPKADGWDARPLPSHDAGADLEPGALWPYVPGTRLCRIHWASLARGGELMQRELTPSPTDLAPIVVVDTHGVVDREAVDWVARTAAAVVKRWASRAGCRVLLPGDRLPSYISADLRGWRELHRRLALLEAGARPSLPGRHDARRVVSIRASDHRRQGAASVRAAFPVGRGSR
jgi:uncharacterized protein (DUF58 family)